MSHWDEMNAGLQHAMRTQRALMRQVRRCRLTPG